MAKIYDHVENSESKDKSFCTICMSDLKESFKHFKTNCANKCCKCTKCSNKGHVSGKSRNIFLMQKIYFTFYNMFKIFFNQKILKRKRL